MHPKQTVLNNFLSYLKKPNPKSERISIKNFFQLTAVMYVSNMLLAVITSIFVIAFVDSGGHAVSQLFVKTNSWNIIVLAVIFAPIREELACRLALSNNKLSLSLGMAFFLVFAFDILFSTLFQLPEWLFNIFDWKGLVSFATAILLLSALFFGIFSIGKAYQSVQKLLTKNYKVWYYFFVLFFGLIHVGNFSNFKEIWFLAIFLVLPQLNTGLFLGYFRVANGIGWAILAHALNNLSAILLVLMIKMISPEITEIFLTRKFELFQHQPLSDLSLMTLALALFMVLMLVASHYFKAVVLDYLRSKNYPAAKLYKVANQLNMLYPAMGQDFLGKTKEANTWYIIGFVLFGLSLVPFAFPIVYQSMQTFLLVAFLPFVIQLVLTYFTNKQLKKVERTGEKHTFAVN